MKRNILKIGSLLVLVVFAFATCSDDPLVKDKVDAKFAVDSPTITISQPENVTAASADLSLTVSSLDEVVELGFIRATKSDFSNSSGVSVSADGSTTVSSTVGVVPLTKYYVKGYAISKSGNTVYSDVLSFETPDAPFIEKITGSYKANMVSYFDDTYTSTITIKPHSEDGKVIIENLDPYFAENGFTADKEYNIFYATYDEDSSTITIPGGQPVGYPGVEFTPLNAEELVLQVKDNGATLSVSDVMWGVYSAGGWYELYLGSYDYIKQ